MPPKAKKPTTTRKKRAPARETKSTLHAKKQMWAVVLFALGLLLAALTLVKGDKLWLSLHNFLFGLCGWSVFFLAPLLVYIAVSAAMDKPLSTIKTKLWQVVVLIIIISGAIQIFGTGLPDEGSFVDNVVSLYEGGKQLRGGGIAGAVFALPLIGLFEVTGAKIIISLAIFVFTMLVTGSTLIGLFRSASKPVKDLEDAYAATVEDKQSRQQEKQQAPPPKGKATKPIAAIAEAAVAATAPRFDIDVDISADDEVVEPNPDDLPGHPVISTRPAPPPLIVPAAAAPALPELADLEDELLPQTARERLMGISGQDRPVEYISPDEFAPVRAPGPEPEPEPTRRHPLDDEINRAEAAEENDPFEIEGIINRFVTQDYIPYEAEHVPDLLTAEESVPRESIPAFDMADGYQPPQIYTHPPSSLLKQSKAAATEDITEELKANAQTLVDTLKSFGVQTRITDICRGPAVTRYELQPSAGVKISKITGLSDDIALNLASAGIRIEAPIPNKPAVGIEVPNKVISMVSIRDIIDSQDFENAESKVTVALGKDIAGNTTLADIGKMPHLLIAGSTGSGKSVCINSIIISILYKSSPDEVKLLMVDPKVVELGIYNGIPHLLVPVVTDPKKAAGALGWAVKEMLDRYKTFAATAVRDLTGYNRLAATRDDLQPMPQIVIIIDELADLMMAAPNEVEDSICRLAQMARAAGMHLVIATQRPSVDVITGVIKANIPSRIAFAVSSQVDSRTILDMGGAEKLLGRGDMLYYPVGTSKPIRVQGCFVTDTEVEKVVSFIKEGENADYDQSIVEEIDRQTVAEKSSSKDKDNSGGGFEDEDDMMPLAIECVVEAGQASTSQLQRRLKLGYARAARIIDQLEERGIVGPFEGSKPRQVLISKDRWIEMKLSGAESAQLMLKGSGEVRPQELAGSFAGRE